MGSHFTIKHRCLCQIARPLLTGGHQELQSCILLNHLAISPCALPALGCGGTSWSRTSTPKSIGERISNPLQYLLCLPFRIKPYGRKKTKLPQGPGDPGKGGIIMARKSPKKSKRPDRSSLLHFFFITSYHRKPEKSSGYFPVSYHFGILICIHRAFDCGPGFGGPGRPACLSADYDLL